MDDRSASLALRGPTTPERAIPLGVVVTSDAHGGGEKYLQDLFTHPTIATRFPATLLGRLPNWSATSLPSVDLGLGAKWSYRNGPREVLREVGTSRRAKAALVAEVGRRRLGLLHMQYKREQISLSRGTGPTPVIWTEHGRLPGGPLRRPLLMAYRRAARDVAAIICVSPAVADEVDMVLGPGGPRRVIIENAVDPAWITPPEAHARQEARQRLGIPDDGSTVVAVVSRIAPTKRVDLALDVLDHLPNTRLVICGDGPSLAELRHRSSGDERVTFTGFLADTRDAYRSADVLLLPTDGSGEGLPLTLLEGACAGLPAVVVAGSGLEPLVRGWGEVAETSHPERVAKAVEAAARIDPENARAWGLAHGFDEWADAHARVFEACLGGAAP